MSRPLPSSGQRVSRLVYRQYSREFRLNTKVEWLSVAAKRLRIRMLVTKSSCAVEIMLELFPGVHGSRQMRVPHHCLLPLGQ